MKTEWYDRMIKALQLNGKGERTQEAYARALRMLVQFYSKSPDLISEEELQDYFLHRKNTDKWSPNTMRICYCGIRFFYEHVLQRNWHILGILRAQNERRLPAVLSVEEVRSILACVKTFQNYAYLSTVYSCGLRLHEGLHLEVSDIDSTRMMIHVHRGKGAKDRYLPFPQSTPPAPPLLDNPPPSLTPLPSFGPQREGSKGGSNSHGQKQCPRRLPGGQV